jgi:coenzyme PQQ precursor peptide PqqA
MNWTTPDFKDINLSFEVTAYVNTCSPENPSQGPDVPTKN